MAYSINSRVKVSPQYWKWLTKRPPCVGDSHTSDGVLYTITGISQDAGRTIVYLSKQQLKRGYR